MALRSQPEAEKADVEELLDVVDKTMDRLKVLYEQYFLGMQKQAPAQIHTDVERRLRELQQVNIRNTGLRYRFATLQQKFGSYNSYWRRTLRQIENGTYIRQLAKVGRKAAMTGAEVPEEILAAMPKRMREQVKRDREQALAIQRRRSGDDGEVDVDMDDAAMIGEAPELRRALPKNAAHALDDDGDFDIDAFFASVTDEDVPSGPPVKTVPLPTVSAKPAPAKPVEQPVTDSTQVVPVVPPPPGRPPSLPRAASQGGAPPPLPPGAKRPPTQPGASGDSPPDRTQLITPVGAPVGTPTPLAAKPGISATPLATKPGISATPLFGAAAKPDAGGPLARPTPLPSVTQPIAVAPPPRTSGAPAPGTPRASTNQPARPEQPATQVVPVVPMPGPSQRPSQPNIPPVPPAPPARPSGNIPSGAKPASTMPSQQSRPNPIAPGAAAARAPVPVQTVGGRAPEKKPAPPQKPPPGMNEADVNALYAKYVKAKEMVGEQAGPGAYGKLLKTINAQAPKIMEQYKAKGVEFSIVVKDNQVVIKAKPKT